jgi:plasmid stabilization system protein ParE
LKLEFAPAAEADLIDIAEWLETSPDRAEGSPF